MISQFELENKLADKLSKMSLENIDQLYLRLFNTDDGLLVLHDLSYGCFANTPLNREGWSQERILMNEGMRCAYLYILDKMKHAVTKQEVSNDES